MTMLRALLIVICIGLLSLQQVQAASRFWNPFLVTRAIAGTGGVCRIDISPIISGNSLRVGSSVFAHGIGGATGCNNIPTTVSAIITAGTIELAGTAPGGAFTANGCLDGGEWNSGNTSNWAASSTATCGSGGQSVPLSADQVTFDANSAFNGVVVVNMDAVLNSLTTGAMSGVTLDWSQHNNTFTINPNGMTFSGTGNARKYLGGTATFNLTGPGTQFDFGTQTNLSAATDLSGTTVNFLGTTNQARTFAGGGSRYGTFAIASNPSDGVIAITGANTFATYSPAPGTTTVLPFSSLISFTTAQNWNGSAAAPILFLPSSLTNSTTIQISTSTATLNWVGLNGVVFTTSVSPTTTNMLDFGRNSGLTMNAPASGGGGAPPLFGGL